MNHEKQLVEAIHEILNVEVENKDHREMHRATQLMLIKMIVGRHMERLQKEEKDVK